MMKRIYFDTEFTGLKKDCDLISIGCVTNDDKYFYAEIKDININKVDKWIKDNVITNCLFLGKNDDYIKDMKHKLDDIKKITYCYGTFSEVSVSFNDWLEDISNEEEIQFVSDVSSYDFVLLIDLITNHGTALDLPKYIVSDCYNINQTIADNLFNTDIGLAFDVTREKYIGKFDEEMFILNEILNNAKHNSLWDAYVIRKIGDRYGL